MTIGCRVVLFFLSLGLGCVESESPSNVDGSPAQELERAADAGANPSFVPQDGGSGLPAEVTYHQHVAPILANNCVTCHQPGGVRAQTPLDNYAAAAPLAATITFYTENRLMPPWYADNSGACGSYRDPLWLTDAEIGLLGAWADSGAPEGASTEEIHEPPSLASLDEPTTTLSMVSDYTPSGSANFAQDDYRCFVVDPQNPTTQFLTGFEVIPGNIKIVHHLLLYRMTTANGDALAAQKDAAEAGEGYTCFGGRGFPKQITSWWGAGLRERAPLFFRGRPGLKLNPTTKWSCSSIIISVTMGRAIELH